MLRKSYKFSSHAYFSLLLALLFSTISGCTGLFFSPDSLIGQNEQTVIAQWGEPTSRIVMPDSSVRLQYSGQPWGRYVWNINLTNDGEVNQAYQALQPSYFYQIPIDGSWKAEDVLREFGPPAFIDHTASWEGDIWNYRWIDNTQHMLFYIYFDKNGSVKRAHQGTEFSTDDRFPFIF